MDMLWLWFLVVPFLLTVWVLLPVGPKRKSISKTEEPKAVTPLPTKAEMEAKAKQEWIASFEGEPTEGSHFIKKTTYTKLAMKDGSEWGIDPLTRNVAEYAPTWWCSCGETGRSFVHKSNFERAEAEALEEATKHVNDHNYIERKMRDNGTGRAF